MTALRRVADEMAERPMCLILPSLEFQVSVYHVDWHGDHTFEARPMLAWYARLELWCLRDACSLCCALAKDISSTFVVHSTANGLKRGLSLQRSIQSMSRSLKLSAQAFLQNSAELSTWKPGAPLMKPNLVARNISFRFPVRLNHLPMSSSPSPYRLKTM